MDVIQKMEAIREYYQNNPGCDPNMNEYVWLCDSMVDYLVKHAPNYGIYEQEKHKYPKEVLTYQKFLVLSKEVEQKLLGNNLGITIDSPLFKLFIDVRQSVATYSKKNKPKLYANLAGVSLLITQNKRKNPNYKYENHSEFDVVEALLNEVTQEIEKEKGK